MAIQRSFIMRRSMGALAVISVLVSGLATETALAASEEGGAVGHNSIRNTPWLSVDSFRVSGLHSP